MRQVILTMTLLAGIAFVMAACQRYPGNAIPTGVATPGHDWMEGGGG